MTPIGSLLALRKAFREAGMTPPSSITITAETARKLVEGVAAFDCSVPIKPASLLGIDITVEG